MDNTILYTIAVLVILITLCLKQGKMICYYGKFITFLFGSLAFATVYIPVMLFRPRDYRNGLFPAWGARQIAKWLGLKYVFRGKENILQDQGTVVLINHQSYLDLIVLAEIWPVLQRCTVISKREIFFLWPFGLAAWLWGTVYINRSAKKAAQENINQVATTINTHKAKICIFPEGTRHGKEDLLPFKKGAFHIAIESQAPIQPIVVTRYTFLNDKTYTFDKGTSIISILPVIHTKGLGKDDLNDLLEKTYNVMLTEYQALNAENKN